MSERPDGKHLERERLSALLEGPETQAEASARLHLETCAECRAEFEALSRMRMALSGLGDLEPPADEWDRIEAALGPAAQGGGLGPGVQGGGLGLRAGWPVQAAAALLLFASGIVAGLQLTSGGSTEAGRVAGTEPGATAGGPRGAGGSLASSRSDDPGAAYVEALTELERLVGAGSVGDGLDPADVAERLTRLEALIGASREAVRESPADPVANALLLQLVEERDALASRLNRSLHLATLEYR